MADERVCSIDGCGKKVKGRGWCAAHLWRFHNHGDPQQLKIKQPLAERCSVSGCISKPDRGRKGLCARHYRMTYRRGTTAPAKAMDGEPEQWLRERVRYSGDECLIWPFARGGDGRGRINCAIGAQAHRVMCILAHGEPVDSNLQAAHSCGRGHDGCVNPKHLRWATPLENAADRVAHGTQVRGEDSSSSILTEDQVRAIRLLQGSFSQGRLGRMFGVDGETVADVLNGRTWAWLDQK
ncbi:HNH endonuclease [Sphingobium sp. SYK-6]|uniref:HNH endonuclease n=1 Tax=Sphingobium sp. (strain NBRC 103272 / SYK-6) TaxID=627192 RepID=UPI001E5B972E|nr:HNH endonuclease [Sphingobium sp. SYK-6]